MSFQTPKKEEHQESLLSAQRSHETSPIKSVREFFNPVSGIILCAEDKYLGPSRVVAENVGNDPIVKFFNCYYYYEMLFVLIPQAVPNSRNLWRLMLNFPAR